MKKAELDRLKVFKDEESMAKANLKVGDVFLYGESIVDQKENKKKTGEEITYYRVVNVKQNGNVIFSPAIDKLED